MSDILEYVEVVVPPDCSCGEFEVSAAVILECQDFVARGCPGVAPYDLEALYFASLADHRTLVDLHSACLQAYSDAAAHGENAALRPILVAAMARSPSLTLREHRPPPPMKST
jgi:hypothetical protein